MYSKVASNALAIFKVSVSTACGADCYRAIVYLSGCDRVHWTWFVNYRLVWDVEVIQDG